MASSREFQESKASLPMCLGASVVGAPVVKDLAECPHLLVAGTTGSGKSAGLNTMLISLLLKRSPSELRLILVDPKQLEFSIYKDLPHLCCFLLLLMWPNFLLLYAGVWTKWSAA